MSTVDEDLFRLTPYHELVTPEGEPIVIDTTSLYTSIPRFISASGRADFARCKRKFYERKVRNLVPKGQVSVDLHAGKCFAAAAEAWRSVTFGGEVVPLGALAYAKEMFDAAWGSYVAPIGHAKQKERVWEAFASMTNRWSRDKDWLTPIKSKRGERAIEWPFAIRLPIEHPDGGWFYYVGIVDMCAHDRNNLVWIEDDKTTRALGEYWKVQWRMSSAQMGYVWAMQQYGLNVHGYVVRGTQIAKTKLEHDEVIEVVAPWRVEQWYERLASDVGAIRQRSVFSRNITKEGGDGGIAFLQSGVESGACGDFGGCPYIDICQARNPEGARLSYAQGIDSSSRFEDLI